jgi:hypothetical protein
LIKKIKYKGCFLVEFIMNKKHFFLLLLFSLCSIIGASSIENKYGNKRLNLVNEQFIRDIQSEMGLSNKAIYVHAFNDEAKKDASGCFVVQEGDKIFLYIDEEAFNTLSIEEKRFIVGHECAHILCNHLTCSENDEDLKRQIEEIRKLKRDNDLTTAQTKLNQLCSQFHQDRVLGFSQRSRDAEFMADEVAVKRLKCAMGAQEWCARNGLENRRAYDPLLDSHPSLFDRYARFAYFHHFCGC